MAGPHAKAHPSGGKEKLGSISNMGNRYIRRLLSPAPGGVISTRKRSDPGTDWLERIITTKPLQVNAMVLANCMARAVWAMLRTSEEWRPA